MRWVDEIVDAIERLGGAARLDDLYAFIEKTTVRQLSRTWRDSIRGRIYENSSDASGETREDLFKHIDVGFWGLKGVDIDADLILERSKQTPDEIVEMVLVREHWRKKPQTGLWKKQAFTIAHADDGKFEAQGLRAFFEYRDLGIKSATKGKFGAHVIRAVPGMESPGTWHSHDLDFQMVYVTRGWVVFEYEGPKEHGGGEQILREGSCVLQPPGIKHREVRHSDDMELIEITSPAEFTTQDETAP